MLKKVFNCFFFLIVAAQYSEAQVMIDGKIHDENSVAIPFAHVLNLNKGLGSVSGEDGFFSLPADIGDSIRFSFIGYSTLIVAVTDEILNRELTVSMKPDYIELPSIWVFSNPKYKVPKKPILPTFRMGPLPEYKNTKPVDPGDFVFKPFAATKPDGQSITTLGPSITLYGPFTYLSKEEREKRKAEEAYLKTYETISFAKLMALKETRNILKTRYELNDSELDKLIVLMNKEFPTIQKIKEPNKIFTSVERYIGSKMASNRFEQVRP
jgi:hypothetical protein